MGERKKQREDAWNKTVRMNGIKCVLKGGSAREFCDEMSSMNLSKALLGAVMFESGYQIWILVWRMIK